ncbi:MAG: response regulator [Bacteroidales bacterium]|nr:response regulator [Bacteroidales bacterium]
MIVSGINIEEVSKAITRELPFGLWSIDMKSKTITGYNKFCELTNARNEQMTIEELSMLVQEDYRHLVLLSIEEIGERGELDLTFPTNQRWLRFKLTHWDIESHVAYGYLVECLFDNDKTVDQSRQLNMMEKQNQMVERLITKVEHEKYDDATESILKDVLASTGCDRVSVIEYDMGDKTQSCTHEVTAYGVEPRVNIIKDIPIDISPWLSREVAKGEVSYVYDVQSLPVDVKDQMNLLGCVDVKSFVIVPLFHREVVIGYMLIDYIAKNRRLETAERPWIHSLGKFVEYSLSITNKEKMHLDDKDQLRSIVDNMPFGFIRLRFLYDAQRKPSDLMIVQINRNLEALIGSYNLEGKLASQVFGKELPHMLSVCMSVAKKGEKRIVDDFFYINGCTVCADVYMSSYNELQCITSTNIQSLFSSNQRMNKESGTGLLMSRDLQHALRTSLNAILGFAELLSAEENENNKEKYMEIIKENAQSLLDSTFIKKSISGQEETSAKESSAAVAPTVDGQRKKVLVAEDTESNYMLVSYILKSEYDLYWAHDGVEALEMYESVKPDIILMDVRMPRLGGLTATSRIRETDKVTPIIALTAFAFESDKAKTLESGCTDFVSKPINAKSLKEIVRKYL